MNDARLQRANRRLIGRLLLLTLGMFGFGFALAPLYDVFCSFTGLNGKTANRASSPVAGTTVSERLVTLELLSNPGTAAGWDFHPQVNRLRVHPGQIYHAVFLARNPQPRSQVVHAVPSVAPGSAARYLHKTECFCFTRQRFAPGEQRELPLTFTVDPGLPAQIGTLSLAYTLYRADDPDSR